jgi:hypothetical protein
LIRFLVPGMLIMVTKSVYPSHKKKTEKPISFQSKEVGFFCCRI